MAQGVHQGPGGATGVDPGRPEGASDQVPELGGSSLARLPDTRWPSRDTISEPTDRRPDGSQAAALGAGSHRAVHKRPTASIRPVSGRVLSPPVGLPRASGAIRVLVARCDAPAVRAAACASSRDESGFSLVDSAETKLSLSELRPVGPAGPESVSGRGTRDSRRRSAPC